MLNHDPGYCLVVFTEERLDVVLHRGSLGGVTATEADLAGATSLEILSADGIWCLTAALDRGRCAVSTDGTWLLQFDRRAAAIHVLPTAHAIGAFLTAHRRS